MMNYFEILDIPESTTDEQVIAAAYTSAQQKYQTMLNQGIGEQQRLAREMMNGKLDDAYETLMNAAQRQRYLRDLKLSQESGVPMGEGRVKVSFSLGEGYSDHEFLVVENPVRHPLQINGLGIESFQEYVCRAWENPEPAIQHVDDRTLERWIYYSAGERDIAEAIKFLRWEPSPTPPENLLAMTLDMLQSRYAAPILPRSPEDWLDSLSDILKPTWRVSPGVANFGLLSGKDGPQQILLQISSWKQIPSNLSAETNHAAVRLDTSGLMSQQILSLSIDSDALDRGQELRAIVTINSSDLGEVQIPVFAARPNRLRGNKELAERINLQAGEAALEKGDYRNAVRFLRAASAYELAAKAEFQLIKQAYRRHDWPRVIAQARQFNDRYGRRSAEVQLWLVEALRMVAGSIFQLGEYRRSLEQLAALACETAYLDDHQALIESWTSKPEAQFQLNVENPKEVWVGVTERYDLNWTHGNGRADGSNYAGPVPLDLSARRIIWRTYDEISVMPPLIAYEGILVGRSRDYRSILGIDAASGRIVWTHSQGLTGTNCAAPVAGDGCVYVSDSDGGLYALDILSGKPRWPRPQQLRDNKDVALTYEDGILFVGEGRRFVIFDAETGEELGSFDELKAWGGLADANPLNLLMTDGCSLFQMVGGPNPSMMFVDLRNDSTLQFEMPMKDSWGGALMRSLIGSTSSSAATWAAWEAEIYIPYLITKELECRSKYRDSEGKVKERVERKSWGELHFFVYGARSQKQLAHIWHVDWGTAYKSGNGCTVSTKEIKPANAIAVTPAYVVKEGETNVYYPPEPDKPLHRLISGAFGRYVYYWTVTDRSVWFNGGRTADGTVQSVAFAGLYDMVTTANSMSTSFIGNVSGGNSTAFFFPANLGSVVGSPAIYGDVVFVTTNSGEVAAVGR